MRIVARRSFWTLATLNIFRVPPWANCSTSTRRLTRCRGNSAFAASSRRFWKCSRSRGSIRFSVFTKIRESPWNHSVDLLSAGGGLFLPSCRLWRQGIGVVRTGNHAEPVCPTNRHSITKCESPATLLTAYVSRKRLSKPFALANSPIKQFGIRLAIEEAIINAIKHGNKLDPSKFVEVRYTIDEEHFLVEIEDEGPGFDPENVPDPTSPENIERPSGRGLLLMKAYMTECDFFGGGTICRMRRIRE